MPTLKRYSNRPGYYIRATHLGRAVTLQLTEDGEEYLVAKLGFLDGSQFDQVLLDVLIERKLVFTLGNPPGEVIVEPEVGDQPPSGEARKEPVPKDEPINSETQSHHRMGEAKEKPAAPLRIRLEAYVPALLDGSTREIVEAVQQTGCSVHGPIPLPTRIENYLVVSRVRRQYEIRTHKRLIVIVEPRRGTIEALSKISLPAGVSITIKATASDRGL
jgi:small subunit ribosomal protein S10